MRLIIEDNGGTCFRYNGHVDNWGRTFWAERMACMDVTQLVHWTRGSLKSSQFSFLLYLNGLH